MPNDVLDTFLFHNSAKLGHLDRIIKIVKKIGFEILNEKTPNKENALHFASANGHTEVVSQLLSYKKKNGQPIMDVNAETVEGATPLFFACQFGYFETAKLLIEHGAHIDKAIKDDDVTPLYIAAQEGYKKTVELLLKNSADKEKANSHGATPLFIASMDLQIESVKLLLKYGANANVQTKNSQSSPLMAAVKGHNFELVKLLVDYDGVDLLLKDNNGQTALDIAKSSNFSNEKIKNYLEQATLKQQNEKAKQVKDNSKTNNNNSWMPIHIAAYNDNQSEIDMIYNKLKSEDNLEAINAKLNSGVTALHLAAQMGNTKIVSKLLSYRNESGQPIMDVNSVDNVGTTPLYVACQDNHFETAKELIEHGADVNISGKEGSTPLYIAAQEGNLETLKLLLDNGANKEIRYNDTSTPLIIACNALQIKAVNLLLIYGANPNAQTRDSQTTPLMMAVRSCHLELVKLLVNHDDIDLLLTDINNMTALDIAKIFGDSHKEIKNCLEKPTFKQKNNLVKKTTQTNNTSEKPSQSESSSPLTASTPSSNLQQNVPDPWLPILRAAFYGNLPEIKRICETFKTEDNLAAINAKLNNGATALHLAAQNGHAEIVSVLLSYGANPNEQTLNGTTALYLAAQNDYPATAKVLLDNDFHQENKAMVDLGRTQTEATPLYVACQEGSSLTAKLLIERGASLTARHNSGATPLHIATQQGHLKCVQLLVESGRVEINATTNNNQKTPLHMATENSNADIVRYLLQNGADPDVQNKGGETAYSIATKKNDKSILKILDEHAAVKLSMQELEQEFESALIFSKEEKEKYLRRYVKNSTLSDNQSSMFSSTTESKGNNNNNNNNVPDSKKDQDSSLTKKN